MFVESNAKKAVSLQRSDANVPIPRGSDRIQTLNVFEHFAPLERNRFLRTRSTNVS